MNALRIFLLLATIVIYAVTISASLAEGINWPAVAVEDLRALGWRSQFDTDFLIYLFLMATWIIWREGADARSYAFGFLSIVMGGMFGFPYLLYAIYKARGEPKALLLGVHVNS